MLPGSEGETYTKTYENHNQIFNLEQMSTKSSTIDFLHRTMFSPVKSTWLRAIRKNHFITWPGINGKDVAKHLQSTVYTAKGHLDRKRKNIKSSTKKNIELDEHNEDIAPPPESKTEEVFIAFLSADTTGTVYTDLTGKFPVTSRSGNKYILLLYHYDSNAIIFRPMKNRSDEEAVRCYREMYEFLKTRNCHPQLNIMDNEASKAVKRFITLQQTKYQLVEPNNHRVNAAERAIRTFKNHFVAGLASVHPQFPLYLWDELLPQAEITLNLLRSSRTCPKISAHAHLHGMFNFMATPLAPPGCKAIIYEDPTHRRSFGTHGISAYYTGPSMEHYRCYQFFIPSTGRKRICATAQFLPTTGSIPVSTPTENILIAANELIEAIKKPSQVLTGDISTNHLSALKKLSEIFDTAAHKARSSKEISPPISAQHPQVNENINTPIIDEPQIPTTSNNEHSTPSQQRHTIPYTNEDIMPRPPTHRYPTRKTNGVHIINEILEHHAMNLVVGATREKNVQYPKVIIWDSTWGDNQRPLTQQQSTAHTKHTMFSVMNADTGHLMSYPQLIKKTPLDQDGHWACVKNWGGYHSCVHAPLPCPHLHAPH